MTENDDDNRVLDAIDHARPAGIEDAAPPYGQGGRDDELGDGLPPSDLSASLDAETRAIVAACALLDPSDTDNGKRLIAHRGKDLAVLQEQGGKRGEPTFAAWSGCHWDVKYGGDRATIIAQSIGALIAAEADFLQPTEVEAAHIAAAEAAFEEAKALRRALVDLDDLDISAKERQRRARALKDDLRRHDKAIGLGQAALTGIAKRKQRRYTFGVTAKNIGRINAFLTMAAPHLVVPADQWDSQQSLLYVGNGALRLYRDPDLESEPPAPGKPETRFVGRVDFTPEGWRREDRVTRMVTVNYDPNARCDRWRAFIERCHPDPAVREALQIALGLGLVGDPVQFVFFHYGLGANGKSVCLEVVARVLGAMAERLPQSSFTGTQQQGPGQASPDIAKLEGARLLVVSEVSQGEPLREELLKQLSGGERMTSRSLFKGYREFQPQFTTHMSGNSYPRVEGSDEGIWRRLVVVHWSVTIPKEERREFETVVGELMEEREGILAWLIEGARMFYTHGVVIPKAIEDASEKMRDELDPISTFFTECVAIDADAEPVLATDFYFAYQRWSVAAGKKPKSDNWFGRVSTQRYEKKRSNKGYVYVGIRVHSIPDVPLRSDEPPPHARNPLD